MGGEDDTRSRLGVCNPSDNRGGDVLERVARGESLTVTRDGRAFAELRPLPRRPVPAAVLLNRWRGLPYVDPAKLRAEIDNVLDASL